MKTHLNTFLITSISLTLGSLVLTSQPSNARLGSYNFSCVNINNIPTTVAQRQGQQPINMINWVIQDGYFGKWTPEKRCQAVSAKFQQYGQQGKLRFITHGEKNGYPIVCVADKIPGDCVGQLYTLRKTSNPQQTVNKLLDVNSIANNGVNEGAPTDPTYKVKADPAYIVKVNNRTYIDMDKYLNSNSNN